MIPFRSCDDETRAEATIVSHLIHGGLIAYPTETIYGIGGSIDSDAVDALLTLKGRDASKAVLMLVSGLEMLASVGATMPPAARQLANAFWPGALTLVLPSEKTDLHHALRGPSGGVAIRWTAHPLLQALIQAFGAPITSTSANRSGEHPVQDPAQIENQWRNAVMERQLLILDGGTCDRSSPSSVVDCTEPVPRVLRAGAIPIDTLQRVVPELTDII